MHACTCVWRCSCLLVYVCICIRVVWRHVCVWRIEYRVCSAVCTVWWSFWVILRPEHLLFSYRPSRKKHGDFRASQNGRAGGREPKKKASLSSKSDSFADLLVFMLMGVSSKPHPFLGPFCFHAHGSNFKFRPVLATLFLFEPMSVCS